MWSVRTHCPLAHCLKALFNRTTTMVVDNCLQRLLGYQTKRTLHNQSPQCASANYNYDKYI